MLRRADGSERAGDGEERRRLEVAVRLARAAGSLLMERFQAQLHVRKKGPIDVVTDVDEAAEALILAGLEQACPEDGVLAEESGGTGPGAAGGLWLVDPLDGTVNYAHGVPHFSVSLGYARAGRVRVGVVFDPVLDELYTARAGAGAWLDGAVLKAAAPAELEAALLSTGFPYDVATRTDNNLNHWGNFIRRAQAVRRTGSAALNLAYVAAGRYDGFWQTALNPWDMAAGGLLVAEAGGVVTDLAGETWHPMRHEILAAAPSVHGAMLAVLALGREGAGTDRRAEV